MSNENMKSSLSAMMDNAADDFEVRRVLTSTDEALLSTWARYQIARSVMHKEPIYPKLDIVSAVSEAIAKEAAEKPEISEPIGLKKPPVSWRSVGKFAVAASILAITLSTVYFLDDGSSSDIANTVYVSSDDSLNMPGVVLADPQLDKKVAELIERHEMQGLIIEEEQALIPQSQQ